MHKKCIKKGDKTQSHIPLSAITLERTLGEAPMT